MGEWKTIFEDEVEGRLVTVKVYESTEVEDQDESPAVRVETTSIQDYAGAPEQEEDGATLIASPEAAGAPITLDPYSLDDLEGELMEVGFSPEAAATIASKVPA